MINARQRRCEAPISFFEAPITAPALSVPVEEYNHASPSEEMNHYLGHLTTKEVRTTRHASESGECPDLEEARAMTVSLRKDISTAFGILPPGLTEDVLKISAEDVPATYWDSASRVDAKHGAITGNGLYDYFRVSPGRDYEAILKANMEAHPEGTVPYSIATGVITYMERLGLKSVDASRIMITHLQKAIPHIQARVTRIAAEQDISRKEATRLAIQVFAKDAVHEHIAYVEAQYDDKAKLTSFINKDSFYDYGSEKADAAGQGEPEPLHISNDDAEGLVELYTLQTRPYSKEALALSEIYAKDPVMQVSFMQFHRTLVEQARMYLLDHPERANGNMEPFSEVFVPEYIDGNRGPDGIVDRTMVLHPNPKLIKAYINNILPAIATSILESGEPQEQPSERAITDGLARAQKARIFQLQIAQLNKSTELDDTIELRSFFSAVCPGSNMFLGSLQALLPSIYGHYLGHP